MLHIHYFTELPSSTNINECYQKAEYIFMKNYIWDKADMYINIMNNVTNKPRHVECYIGGVNSTTGGELQKD